MHTKQEFYNLYEAHIHRAGSGDLKRWIMQSSFERDPASTKFHGNYSGGLLDHSVNVFQRLWQLKDAFGLDGVGAETIAIVALLHDLCKVGKYKIEMRNVKIDGAWIQKPFYKSVDDNPFGYHGPASVFLIQKYMKLTDEEIAAIACHMGAYDRLPTDYSLSDVYQKYPLAYALHTADCLATFYDEEAK